MIAHLTGTLLSKEPAEVVIDVAGVGYAVGVPVSTLTALPAVGERVSLFTHHHVREDQLALFGFATAAEQRLFRQLIGVSGIGPKVGLAILSVSNPDDIRSAIAGGDTEFIAQVPGIGKKTAERVVIDLKDKVEMVTIDGSPRGTDDVVEALVGLGYSRQDARKAVSKVASQTTETDELVRAALKELAS